MYTDHNKIFKLLLAFFKFYLIVFYIQGVSEFHPQTFRAVSMIKNKHNSVVKNDYFLDK
jgi:hypothetical protein